MNHLQQARMQKLIDHLSFGKLGHVFFDFSCWNGGSFNRAGCGTSGCAIGECPILFPDEWEFRALVFRAEWGFRASYDYVPSLKREPTSTILSASKFFGITYGAVRRLFMPFAMRLSAEADRAEPLLHRLPRLKRDATRHQVARSLKLFLARVRKQQRQKQAGKKKGATSQRTTSRHGR